MTDINLTGQQIQGYTIIKKLGSGGYGTVYLGMKEELGKQYRTAIKYISLPDADGYEAVLQDYGYDKAAAQTYFEKMVADITSEINMLMELSKRDNRYIVAYYDHEIRKCMDPLRYEIFMRMEYLTSLSRHIRQNGMTVGEVIRLGMNMCDALSLCHGNGVMHRDIKEANIFVSENGNFKLGDFGVAKTAIETSQTGSMAGTASYMAPEIYRREPYDKSVDIYSLGIVLYKLLNRQRLPFMPDAPAQFTADDKIMAETRRLKGETPPLPVCARNRLGEIIVKACSAREERYKKAEEFREELQIFLDTLSEEERGMEVVPPAADNAGDQEEGNTYHTYTQTQGATMTMGAQAPAGTDAPQTDQNPYAPKPRKKKWKIALVVVILILLAAAFIAGYLFISEKLDPLNQFREAIEENDYEAAAQLYRDELKNGDSSKLAEVGTLVANRGEEIKEIYYQGGIEYEDALNQLQELEKLGAEGREELRAAIEDINGLYLSRTAYKRAQESMESGDYESAITDLHKVIQDDPDYVEAQKKIAEAIKGYKDGVLASLSNFEPEKQYDEAILTLKAGLLVVPEDADFLAKIADYEKKIEDEILLTIDSIIREAKSVASVSADYEGALGNLRAAAKQYPNSEELKTAISEIEREHQEKIVENARSAVSESADYANALGSLRAAAKQYPNSEGLKAAISEIEEEYLGEVLAEAETIVGESGYVEAVAALNEALQLLPNNATIKTAIAEYEAKYPVLLQQMVYFTGRTLENGGQQKDNMQKMQINIIQTDKSGTFDNTYKLEGQYVRITGVLYQPFDYRSDNYVRTLKIFGDGRLLYSNKMRGGIEPIPFDIDITGVSDFEISFVDDWGSSRGYARLANVELHQ